MVFKTHVRHQVISQIVRLLSIIIIDISIMVLALINLMCDDIKREIYSFIPKHHLMWCSKEYYLECHSVLHQFLLSKSLYDTYIRNVIRRDLHFVFSTIMSRHHNPGWKKKRYHFRNVKYENYFHFMDCFMFENNAHNCRNMLFTNVFRKKYKKINRNIAWTN